MYGTQKGATPEACRVLDSHLTNWADLVTQVYGNDLRDTAGAGAAGGLAFGLASVLGARLTPGLDLMLELTGFEDASERCLNAVLASRSMYWLL